MKYLLSILLLASVLIVTSCNNQEDTVDGSEQKTAEKIRRSRPSTLTFTEIDSTSYIGLKSALETDSNDITAYFETLAVGFIDLALDSTFRSMVQTMCEDVYNAHSHVGRVNLLDIEEEWLSQYGNNLQDDIEASIQSHGTSAQETIFENNRLSYVVDTNLTINPSLHLFYVQSGFLLPSYTHPQTPTLVAGMYSTSQFSVLEYDNESSSYNATTIDLKNIHDSERWVINGTATYSGIEYNLHGPVAGFGDCDDDYDSPITLRKVCCCESGPSCGPCYGPATTTSDGVLAAYD